MFLLLLYLSLIFLLFVVLEKKRLSVSAGAYDSVKSYFVRKIMIMIYVSAVVHEITVDSLYLDLAYLE